MCIARAGIAASVMESIKPIKLSHTVTRYLTENREDLLSRRFAGREHKYCLPERLKRPADVSILLPL